jgi:acyl-CoA reductase-like NAD-dependent aldehyde dehydrogenase
MATTVSSAERATSKVQSSAAMEFVCRPKLLLIGGKWVAAKSGKTFETINPATEQTLAQVAEGDRADVDEAVNAARKAFEQGKWPAMGPHQRARYLFKIADLIEEHTDELAMLESMDNGKPLA